MHECRGRLLLVLLQVPLCDLERRRKARLEYCELYKRTHNRLKNFRDPDR